MRGRAQGHARHGHAWGPAVQWEGGGEGSTPTTGLRERGNDTSGSTGRQNAATRRNMRREERVTVQGPVKEQQPDGMSHGRGGAGPDVCGRHGAGGAARHAASGASKARPAVQQYRGEGGVCDNVVRGLFRRGGGALRSGGTSPPLPIPTLALPHGLGRADGDGGREPKPRACRPLHKTSSALN